MPSEPPFVDPLDDREAIRADLSPADASPPDEAITAALRAPLRPPPPPPQPGFWASAFACFLMLVIAQFVVPVGLMVLLLLAKVIVALATTGDMRSALNWLGSEAGAKALTKQIMMPLMAFGQVTLIVLSLIVLRLIAGRYWRREIALRPPSLTHFVLAVVGFPALPILAGGIYLGYREGQVLELLPRLAALPALAVALAGVVLWACAIWLILRLATGRNCLALLRQSSLSSQLLVVVPAAAFALFSLWATYYLIHPYVFHLTMLDTLDGQMEELVQDAREWYWPIAVLIIGLGPGLGEELWCRAFLGRGLLGHYGVVMGIVLASFFFGAIHVLPGQGFMAALMGIVLHFTYVTTRSLMVPMLLHCLNNSLAIAGHLLFEDLEKVDTHPEAIGPAIYVASALLFLAVGWALYQTRARLWTPPESPLPPWQPPYPGVALPPPGTSTVVTHPWPWWQTTVAVALGVAAFWGVIVLETLGL